MYCIGRIRNSSSSSWNCWAWSVNIRCDFKVFIKYLLLIVLLLIIPHSYNCYTHYMYITITILYNYYSRINDNQKLASLVFILLFNITEDHWITTNQLFFIHLSMFQWILSTHCLAALLSRFKNRGRMILVHIF